MSTLDAIVIGSGPNGLTAAIVLARAGRSVTVFEAGDTIGGGARSAALTLPGFVHDVCSAIHAFAPISPAFKSMPLEAHGLQWVEAPAMLAHPLDNGTAAVVERSVEATATRLGADARAYRRLYGRLVEDWPRLEPSILGPLRFPKHPFALARFGLTALESAKGVARHRFSTARTRALFAGIAAHGMLPLDMLGTGAFGLVLGATAHVGGWPFPRGGAQSLSNALAAYLQSLGGIIVTGTRVDSFDDLPPARAILCDLSPKPLLRIARQRFPPSYRRKLEQYRYGMGVFKADFALDGPIPWRAPECARAATVHVGGTLEEIAGAEHDAWHGHHPDRPFVLLVQPTLFDPSRAPAGKHTAWAYCHVPHGSSADMLARIEQQIERFAPGFRGRVLARSVMTATEMERYNPNYAGGDIAAGTCDLRQLFARPTWSWYSTPARGVYICSAATPPGVGVHGMCGYFAAELALGDVLED
jgi:phytoene dehydrogenase-like protein